MNINNNLNKITNILPRKLNECSIFFSSEYYKNKDKKHFSITPKKILSALIYLKNNNKTYEDVIISYGNLSDLVNTDKNLVSIQQNCVLDNDQIKSNSEVSLEDEYETFK